MNTLFKFKWQSKTYDLSGFGWMDSKDETTDQLVALQIFQRLSEGVAEGYARNLIVETV